VRYLIIASFVLLLGCPTTSETVCDWDADGYDDATLCDGLDCDDRDPEIHPGMDETCDDLDRDCDGSPHDGAIDVVTWSIDADGDGFGDPEATEQACEWRPGLATGVDDCDDADPAVGPERSGWPDLDGDGFGDAAGPVTTCDYDLPLVDAGGDCDDTDAAVHPDADDVCNDIDDDCDGEVDEAKWYRDADGDGWGSLQTSYECDPGPGWVAETGDCDDDDPSVHPDAVEICGNGIDEDCDDLPRGCGLYGDALAWDLADLRYQVPGYAGPWALVASPSVSGDDGWDLVTSGTDFVLWRVYAQDGALSGDHTLAAQDYALGGGGAWTDLGRSLAVLETGDADGVADLVVARPDDVSVLDLPLPASRSPMDGRARILIASPPGFGWPIVASGGDIDGDGVDDLLIGEPWWGDDAGRVLVFYGPVTGVLSEDDADAVIVGQGILDVISWDDDRVDEGDAFGYALTALGDTDGDGFGEFAVGAPGWNRGDLASSGIDSGAVFVFSGPLPATGGPATAIATLPGAQGHGTWSCTDDGRSDDDDVAEPECWWDEAASFAGMMLAAGDSDGDGLTELLHATQYGTWSAPWESDGGLALALQEGPWSGTEEESTAEAWLHVYGEPFGYGGAVGWFCSPVVFGDFDADGRSDLAFGFFSFLSAPMAWIDYGPLPATPADLEDTADAVLRNSSDINVGGECLAAGDLDQDGWDDLAMGKHGGTHVLVFRGGPGL